jgi:hypothetical protein
MTDEQFLTELESSAEVDQDEKTFLTQLVELDRHQQNPDVLSDSFHEEHRNIIDSHNATRTY